MGRKEEKECVASHVRRRQIEGITRGGKRGGTSTGAWGKGKRKGPAPGFSRSKEFGDLGEKKEGHADRLGGGEKERGGGPGVFFCSIEVWEEKSQRKEKRKRQPFFESPLGRRGSLPILYHAGKKGGGVEKKKERGGKRRGFYYLRRREKRKKKDKSA